MSGKEKKELIQLKLTGKNAEVWERLNYKLFNAIDSVTEKFLKEGTDSSTAKDLVKLTFDFVKAKTLKPTLENEKLKAEITLQYAQARKEAALEDNIQQDTLSKALANLEKLIQLTLLIKGHRTEFHQLNEDAHLLTGVNLHDLLSDPIEGKSIDKNKGTNPE